ncbi:glycosyltransferase [Exiguobacterium acetylicum]|uniref:glycosyltransferase n=1 Tax=Exiguobacterium acetylicum TaxID=41170 RepID=UPI001EE2F308|nr:glycosyltransferase [Exiguobacterium acetylicum]UKS55702.1 glycosyltransferase [Exiguobacterium acetylicum]
MKIPIVCYKFPPHYSGYGKQLSTILKEMQNVDKKRKFIILTAFGKSYEGENFSVKSFGFDYSKSNKKTLYSFSLKVLLWIIKNRKNIPLVHCIKAGPEAFFTKVGCIITSKPIIVKIAQDELSSRELKNKNMINKLRIRFRQRFLLHSTNLIAISSDIQKLLNNSISGNSKVWFIPNGVDTRKFNVESKINESESVDLLYVGAINRRKGIYDLLEALNTIKLDKKANLTLCGPLLEDLNFEKKLRDINENKNNLEVKYLGNVDNVDQIMNRSDVFLLLSYSEGLPNVLLEASSSGLPLIGTDIPGSRDIVQNDFNGKIVDPGDILGIKNAIQFFVNKSDCIDKMGNNSRKLIESKYDVNVVAKQYFNMYNELSGVNHEKN